MSLAGAKADHLGERVVFTIVVDVDTTQDAARPEDVRDEIERLLTATTRVWPFRVWPKIGRRTL